MKELISKGLSIRCVSKYLGFSRGLWYKMMSTEAVSRTCSRRNEAEDKEILDELVEWRSAGHNDWGYRRLWAHMRFDKGYIINKKRVYRIMKAHNLLLVNKKRERANNGGLRGKRKASRINEVWGIDMTKFMIGGIGWVYFVAVLDWYSKRLVGYSVSIRGRTQEWLLAIDKAINSRFPDGVRGKGLELVSDNGSQPTSVAFVREMNELGIKQIFTSYNNPKGNADTERFMRTFKEEVVYTHDFSSLEEATCVIEKWVEYYNKEYPHSSLKYLSPEKFEKQELDKIA